MKRNTLKNIKVGDIITSDDVVNSYQRGGRTYKPIIIKSRNVDHPKQPYILSVVEDEENRKKSIKNARNQNTSTSNVNHEQGKFKEIKQTGGDIIYNNQLVNPKQYDDEIDFDLGGKGKVSYSSKLSEMPTPNVISSEEAEAIRDKQWKSYFKGTPIEEAAKAIGLKPTKKRAFKGLSEYEKYLNLDERARKANDFDYSLTPTMTTKEFYEDQRSNQEAKALGEKQKEYQKSIGLNQGDSQKKTQTIGRSLLDPNVLKHLGDSQEHGEIIDTYRNIRNKVGDAVDSNENPSVDKMLNKFSGAMDNYQPEKWALTGREQTAGGMGSNEIGLNPVNTGLQLNTNLVPNDGTEDTSPDFSKYQNGGDIINPDDLINLETQAKTNLLDIYNSPGYQQKLNNEVIKSKEINEQYRPSFRDLYDERLNNVQSATIKSADLSNDNSIGALELNTDKSTGDNYPQAYIDLDMANHHTKYNPGIDNTPKYVALEELEHNSHVPKNALGNTAVPHNWFDKREMSSLNITPYAHQVIKDIKRTAPFPENEYGIDNTSNVKKFAYLGNPTEMIARKRRLEQMLIEKGKLKAGEEFNDEHFDLLEKENPDAFKELMYIISPNKKVTPENKQEVKEKTKRLFNEIANTNQNNNLMYAQKGGKVISSNDIVDFDTIKREYNNYQNGGDIIDNNNVITEDFDIIDQLDVLPINDSNRFATKTNKKPVGFKYSKMIINNY